MEDKVINSTFILNRHSNLDKERDSNDLISTMSFFAHGTAFDMPNTVENPGYEGMYAIAMGYSADDAKRHNNKLNIFVNDIAKINSSAFAKGNYTRFGSCRTGNTFNGINFAQQWAYKTNGSVMAAYGPNGRTQYNYIFPDNRSSVSRLLAKFGFSQPKATRELAREKYGFSETGSVNYPGLVGGAYWKMFYPR